MNSFVCNLRIWGIMKATCLMLGFFVVSGNHHQHGSRAVLIGQHVKLTINTLSCAIPGLVYTPF